MVIGFVGSGNMAAAIARGWADEGERMLFSDSGSGRAAALAAEVGGEVAGNAEIAAAADLVVLAVKPAKLDEVAPQLGEVRHLVSVLGATPLARLRQAFPAAEVLRAMPNVGVELRRGVLCVAGDAAAETRARLAELGLVVELPDEQIDAATAVMGCSPAFFALVVEALADAGAEAGLDPALAHELVVETMAGTAELLRIRQPTELRRAVASPGGSTEAGLQALAREGAAPAFAAAVAAALERMRG